MTAERMKEILVGYIDKDLDGSDSDWVRETLADLCSQDELKELGLWDWLRLDEHYTITAKCSCCGREEDYTLNDEEYRNLERYYANGCRTGMMQDLFPNIPAWIRSGAIDTTADGFCICPNCGRR